MKNFLTPVLENKIVKAVNDFYVKNESIILTSSTIGFSLATTAVTFRNADKIKQCLYLTRDRLNNARTNEEKKEIYKSALKELTPLVTPILIFQTATIVATVKNKKQSDKKLAELTSAITVANQAITQYKVFKDEAETALTEKKLDTVYENIEKKAQPVLTDISPADGEILFKDPYSNQVFVATEDRIKLACERLNSEIKDNDVATIDGEYYETLDVEPTELSQHWGYFAENDHMNIGYRKVLTDILTPTGMKPGYAIYLYPEPEYIPG